MNTKVSELHYLEILHVFITFHGNPLVFISWMAEGYDLIFFSPYFLIFRQIDSIKSMLIQLSVTLILNKLKVLRFSGKFLEDDEHILSMTSEQISVRLIGYRRGDNDILGKRTSHGV